ncbi:MAG TPA: hypothetical protein VFY23_16775 [Candidatus Limnocylindrales bacterium]|nr:hypothetical protein [Candidatus Limnocylindrales bacterium]
MGRFLALPVALLLALSVVAPAAAADDPFVFPAGMACEFALGYSGTDAMPNVSRTFYGDDETMAWSLDTGRGGTATLYNMDTDAMLTIGTTGARARTVYHPDGSSTSELTGGWILIMFPTDDPAGPDTTQVLGRITYDTSAGGVTTLKSVSGRQLDICAALS